MHRGTSWLRALLTTSASAESAGARDGSGQSNSSCSSYAVSDSCGKPNRPNEPLSMCAACLACRRSCSSSWAPPSAAIARSMTLAFSSNPARCSSQTSRKAVACGPTGPGDCGSGDDPRADPASTNYLIISDYLFGARPRCQRAASTLLAGGQGRPDPRRARRGPGGRPFIWLNPRACQAPPPQTCADASCLVPHPRFPDRVSRARAGGER